MEVKDGLTPPVALRGGEAPGSYHVAPRTENSTLFTGPTMQSAVAAPAIEATPLTTVASVAAPPVSAGMSGPRTGSEVKKKRGRPRKYGQDGAVNWVTMALSPMPISSSIPLTGEYSAWKQGRGKPADTIKKSNKFEFESSGDVINPLLSFSSVRYLGRLLLVLFYCYIGYHFLSYIGLTFLARCILIGLL
ncbi:hypothetical protein SLEP1_g26951 [Rubroshorea leprosula]|uniref:AT-hook motif nuclear-localized protein n=1 Tax=Rubroshorea leprosula TaxID=152421 RepID=A0AAV5JZI2_9ROSI|nr:hypothetical protein SLEP1_g26951 [Rubroshorea leprosula]